MFARYRVVGLLCLLFGAFAAALQPTPSSAQVRSWYWHVWEVDVPGEYTAYYCPGYYAQWGWEYYGATDYYPVVCYLHGFNAEAEWDRLEPTLHELAQRGYLVIAVKWQSGGDLWAFNRYQDNVAAKLRRALRDWDRLADESQFAIVGHSMGGMLGLKMAHLRPSGIPQTKAIVLHDGAGFWFHGLIYGFTAGLNDLGRVPASTQLLCLMADDSYITAITDEYDGGLTRFRDHNAGGVVSRAWHNTPAMMRRQCLWVLDNPDLGVASEHLGIYTPGIREVYWKHTGDALQDAFNGDDYFPDLSERYRRGEEKVVKLPAWFFTIPR